MSTTTSAVIMRNTAYNSLARVVALASGILLTPYIVHRLGMERFAIWSFVGVVTGYISLFDLGIGTAYVKHVAEFNARGQQQRIGQLVATGMFFYLLFGLAVVCASLWFIMPLIRLFNVPAGLITEAVFVFWAGICIFAVGNALSPFAAVQPGLQRMDISSRINIGISLCNAAATVAVLQLGWGIRGLIMVNAAVLGLQSLVNYTVARKLLPLVSFSPLCANRSMFSTLFHFGYKVQIARISSVVTMQTDKILVASFVSLGMVTFYQLGNGVIYYAGIVPALLVSAFMPAFSEMQAKGESRRLTESYLRATRYVAAVAVPMFVFLAVCAPAFFTAWMGPGYERSAFVLRVLCFSWMLNSIAQVGGSVAMAVDYLRVMAKSALLIIVLNVALSVVLVRTVGFYGVAWGTLVAVNCGTLYFLNGLHRRLGLSNRRVWEQLLPSLLCAFLSAAAVLVLTAGFPLRELSRPLAAAVVLLQAAAFCAGYVFLNRIFSVFTREDIAFFSERLPQLRPLLRLFVR